MVPRKPSAPPPLARTRRLALPPLADDRHVAGLGYLGIKDPQNYHDLPRPLVGYAGHVATTSMTHQLHCLVCLASALPRATAPRRGRCHGARC